MVRFKKRFPLSKKDRRKLREMLGSTLERVNWLNMEACGKIEKGETGIFTVYLCDGICFLVDINGLMVPCLKHILKRQDARSLADILVDRGAVKALLRGADLMAPGVTSVRGEFGENEVVVIGDSETGAPVAIGVSLVDSDALREMAASKSKGRVVRILHHVGDKIWEAL